jgi:hypothetical protein
MQSAFKADMGFIHKKARILGKPGVFFTALLKIVRSFHIQDEDTSWSQQRSYLLYQGTSILWTKYTIVAVNEYSRIKGAS